MQNCEIIDCTNPAIVKAIQDKALALDIEFMCDEDIQALYDAGVREFQDLNSGPLNLADYI